MPRLSVLGARTSESVLDRGTEVIQIGQTDSVTTEIDSEGQPPDGVSTGTGVVLHTRASDTVHFEMRTHARRGGALPQTAASHARATPHTKLRRAWYYYHWSIDIFLPHYLSPTITVGIEYRSILEPNPLRRKLLVPFRDFSIYNLYIDTACDPTVATPSKSIAQH